MSTIKISTTDNRVLDVTAKELAEIIKIDGLDKIEVCDKHGWEYMENRMMEIGFNWDSYETISENVNRFWVAYENFLLKPTREEEFGNLVNEAI